ncbi:MAG: hypothetical protein O7A65_02505 [Proteobacteria bacterium]|nr:hypothetical protein [Pseudomonadota bacterium]
MGMNPVHSIALGGLLTASLRLAVSAVNIANALTSRPVETLGETPPGVYEPKQVEQSSLANGGVKALIRPVDPASFLIPDPTSPTGLAAFPNVDIVNEIVQLLIAESSFRANIEVLRTEARMGQALLDIRA